MARIIGENLYFRAIEVEDWEHGYRWINDPETARYLPHYLPLSRLQEREWYEERAKAASDTSYHFAIVLKANDHYIGNISLFDIHWRARQAELGILIGEPSARGVGYGSEALRLLLCFAFDQLGLHRVWLRVDAQNQQALRAYEKVGFRREGVARDDEFYEGAFHDTITMSVLEPEYRTTE